MPTRFLGVALSISFSVRDSGPVREVVLSLDGELDTDSARSLEQRMRNLPEADVVVINLSRLSFIDSTGLSLLVTAKNREGDRLRLIGARPPVSHIFESTGTSSLLETEV